jgi:hypothetical protein
MFAKTNCYLIEAQSEVGVALKTVGCFQYSTQVLGLVTVAVCVQEVREGDKKQ